MTSELEDMVENLRAYVVERDKALLACDVDGLDALYKKYHPGFAGWPRETMEVAVHKARLILTTLPEAEKEKSRLWLSERGYRTWV